MLHVLSEFLRRLLPGHIQLYLCALGDLQHLSLGGRMCALPLLCAANVISIPKAMLFAFSVPLVFRLWILLAAHPRDYLVVLCRGKYMIFSTVGLRQKP